MMPLRRASVIVALSLLTSTATAYAACAWVLWEELIISGAEGGASQWRIVNSWPDPAACHAGRGREPFLRAASSRELRYMPDIHAVALIAPDGSVRSVTKF